MREILFRGKMDDNSRWVEGYYCRAFRWTGDKEPVPAIQEADCFMFRAIDPSTVGQYTGMKDRNGKRIFDGDIVRTKYGRVCKVTWFSSEQYSGWDFEPVSVKHDPPDQWDLFYDRNLVVLGNIHDNPELLEELK